MKIPVAIAPGEGIGPEIMEATLHILQAAGAALDPYWVQINGKTLSQGIPPVTWEILKNTRAFLKGPASFSPESERQRNTICSTLGLYANIQPCIIYPPFVATNHLEMNFVLIYGNEEDLFANIEYRQTPTSSTALRMISQAGCERVIRYAFEYAHQHKRKAIACFAKDSLLQLTEGLFHATFAKIALEYPHILNEYWDIDRGAAKLTAEPEDFDVIVLPNLYGNLLSQISSRFVGPLSFGSIVKIGNRHALFETTLEAETSLAGKNVANPSGLLLAATQMLAYLGQSSVADLIYHAWLRTLEEGFHPSDIYQEKASKKKLGTREFGEEIVKHLGKKPEFLKPVSLGVIHPPSFSFSKNSTELRHLVGLDITIYHGGPFSLFFARISHIAIGPLKLKMILNRGVRIWPQGNPETFCIDQWTCRFTTEEGRATSQDDIIRVMHAFDHVNMDVIKVDFLYTFSGTPGYSV